MHYVVLAILEKETADYRRNNVFYYLDETAIAQIETLPFDQDNDKKNPDKAKEQLQMYFEAQTSENYRFSSFLPTFRSRLNPSQNTSRL